MKRIAARCLVEGRAEGEPQILPVALSFWGGFDVATGRIVEPSHPSFGAVLTDRILIMPAGRGSSSASSILAEAIRRSTAPAGIILTDADPILVVGSIVARQLYGRSLPIVVCGYAFEARGQLRILAQPEADGSSWIEIHL